MAYRNQSPNCGNQNVNAMQRGMMSQRSTPYVAMSGNCNPIKDIEACNPVIVSSECETMKDKSMVMGDQALVLGDLPLAMAYVPWQRFQNLYNEVDALKSGTIFKELNLEFCRKGCK